MQSSLQVLCTLYYVHTSACICMYIQVPVVPVRQVSMDLWIHILLASTSSTRRPAIRTSCATQKSDATRRDATRHDATRPAKPRHDTKRHDILASNMLSHQNHTVGHSLALLPHPPHSSHRPQTPEPHTSHIHMSKMLPSAIFPVGHPQPPILGMI